MCCEGNKQKQEHPCFNSSQQRVQKWFLKSKEQLVACWSLIISFANTIPTGTKSKDIVCRLKKKGFISCGKFWYFVRALFSIRTTRRNLQISRIKEIVEEKNSREENKFFVLFLLFSWMKQNSWLLPALEDFLFSYSERLDKSFKSSVGSYTEKDKPLNLLRVSAKEITVSHPTLKAGAPKLKTHKAWGSQSSQITHRVCTWTEPLSSPSSTRQQETT